MLVAPKTSDSNFISKMKSSGRNVVVFYGSQTGTAEEFAGRLAKEAARYGMKALIADPEECDMVSVLFRLSNTRFKVVIYALFIFKR